jgi:NDP-sugar pyrophosphorylase family protein
MKIIIPMTGTGSRFSNKGYKQIKPLITVHNKPIISYVIDLFPGETNFVFICRDNHLQETNLEATLKELMPTGEIISLKGEKLGPVKPITQIMDRLDDNEPIIINYCDYFMNWDYQSFKNIIQETPYDGAIPCYTGFHPHLRHEKNVYAGCRIDSEKTLLEIKEKHSFESDMFKGHHSVGLYYFKQAKDIKHYFPLTLNNESLRINGEYYISVVYQLMLQDKKRMYVHDDIPHFCQWGTPEDFEEYLYWSNIFLHPQLTNQGYPQ